MSNQKPIFIAMWKLISFIGYVTSESRTFEPFIVHGTYARIVKYPFAAYLSISCRVYADDKQYWWCGASILNQLIILTAAHCLDKTVCQSGLKAALGIGSAYRGEGYARFYRVISFKIHEDYNIYTHVNDIALLKLDKPLTFGNNVKRVALATTLITNEVAAVAGWGIVEPHQPAQQASPLLKEAKQLVLTREECTERERKIPPGMFCGISEITKSKIRREFGYPLSGDSGGALVVRGYLQIGVTAVHILSRYQDQPLEYTGYTDVTYFKNWIKRWSRRLNCGRGGHPLTKLDIIV